MVQHPDRGFRDIEQIFKNWIGFNPTVKNTAYLLVAFAYTNLSQDDETNEFSLADAAWTISILLDYSLDILTNKEGSDFAETAVGLRIQALSVLFGVILFSLFAAEKHKDKKWDNERKYMTIARAISTLSDVSFLVINQVSSRYDHVGQLISGGCGVFRLFGALCFLDKYEQPTEKASNILGGIANTWSYARIAAVEQRTAFGVGTAHFALNWAHLCTAVIPAEEKT